MNTTIRVLVVDDLPHWAEVIRSFAQLYACDMRQATNLSAAIKQVAHWQPHIILLDLHMPRDAWQPIPSLQKKYGPAQKTLAFCEQITSHPKLQDVRVVITSVEDQSEQKEAGLAAGAHAFYTKSDFTVELFADLLNQAAAPTPP